MGMDRSKKLNQTRSKRTGNSAGNSTAPGLRGGRGRGNDVTSTASNRKDMARRKR